MPRKATDIDQVIQSLTGAIAYADMSLEELSID